MATIRSSMTKVEANFAARPHRRAIDFALLTLLTAGMAVLWGRILAYPLQHDEQFYVPAGILFSWHGLYDELGFSHLPNLALLLHALYALPIGDHYLLVGRLVVCAAWTAAVAALIALGRLLEADRLTLVLMVALLVVHPLLLGPTGMATTNNFIPVPLLLFGLFAFLNGIERVAWRWFALSGLFLSAAAGLKANYGLLVVPFALVMLSMARRRQWRTGAIAFLVSGLIAALPTLFFLTRPATFAAHALAFQRGPQIAYWLAHPDPADPKILSLRGKILLAQQLWFDGISMVIVLTAATLAISKTGRSPERRRLSVGPAARGLLAAMLAIALIVAFVPKPAFPQYYALPIPIGIALIAALRQRLDDRERLSSRPILAAALAITLFNGAPALLRNPGALLRPADWAGLAVHADARRLATAIPLGNSRDIVATLAPLYPLEAGGAVLPQLGLGPFIYRAVDYASADSRRYFVSPVSPATVEAALWRICPAAVLVGLEGDLDVPLSRFADAAHYKRSQFTLRGRDQKVALLLTRPPLGCSASR